METMRLVRGISAHVIPTAGGWQREAAPCISLPSYEALEWCVESNVSQAANPGPMSCRCDRHGLADPRTAFARLLESFGPTRPVMC